MSYRLTIMFDNDYDCSCCRNTWTEEEIFEDLQEAAAFLVKARTSGSSRCYGYEIALHGQLTEEEDDVFKHAVLAVEKDLAEKSAAKQKKAKHEADIASLKAMMAEKEAHLNKNQHLYNEPTIEILSSEILHLKKALNHLCGSVQ